MSVTRGALVVIHLANPTEKFWGVLERLEGVGVTFRGISSVEVLQGPTAKRPLLVFSANTEGQVFKALSASASTLLHVRDTSPGAIDSFEIVCRAPDGGNGGRFTMSPAEAQEIIAGRIDLPTYFVRYVQF